MSQPKKKKTVTKAVDKAASPKATDSDRQGRWTRYIIILVVVAIIGIAVGVFYYQEYIAPRRITVIKVDDTSIRMDYFLKRLKIAPIDPMNMLDSLQKEELIRMDAPALVGELTEDDIDQGLRNIASGGSGNITESEFKEWYRQQLNETGFTDAEFREYVGTNVLATRLQIYLAERVSTVAEQFHVHMIVLETYDDAIEVRTRWEEGEDFAELAREVTLDENYKENGGDLGWMPSGVDDLIDFATRDLDIGVVSQPVTETGTYFYLFLISEREVARPLDEEDLRVLQSKVLNEWLISRNEFHKITYHGFNNGFDSETYAWVNWQLSKQ